MPAESREHVAQGAVFPSCSSDMRLFFPGAFLLICRAEGLIVNMEVVGQLIGSQHNHSSWHQGWPGCQDSLGSGSISLAVGHLLTLDRDKLYFFFLSKMEIGLDYL